MSLKSPEEKREQAKYSRIKRVYGITREQYDSLNTGICPLCLREYTAGNPACLDHDHHSGEIRNVCCRYCNHRLIGRHRDYELIQRLANYLKGPHTGWIVPPKPKKKRRKKKAK